MASSIYPLRIQKRLLQFNELPFAFGEVTQQSYTAAFKGEVVPYTNAAHGGYYPSIGDWGKLQTSSFDADLTFDFSEIDCTEKARYFRFIKRQLSKSGKLFATQGGNEIIWTNARIVSINEVVDIPSEKDKLRLNVSFELIDGYWRIASRTRLFIQRYCPNNFRCFDPTYCYDATDLLGRCDETGASKCVPCEMTFEDNYICDDKEWRPMCNFAATELENMFGVNCANQWAINYSCQLEKDFFCFDVPWGRKYRLRADSNYNEYEFDFCSKTDFPTEFVRVRLAGSFMNPYVRINDDRVKAKTTLPVNGILTMGFGPEIYVTDDTRDPESNTRDVSTKFDRSNTPFFEVKPGKNHVVVKGQQYHSDSFIYIEPIEITW